MSFQRRTLGIFASPAPKGAGGERLCRNCHGPMPSDDKRLHNCSPECIKEWSCKTSPSQMRQAVFDRDRGVCAICGTDTIEGRICGPLYRHIARGTGDRWHADHITPVIEGGGECGLDNYRTLCIPCHKKVTRDMHSRLASLRKAKNTSKIGLLQIPVIYDTAEERR